MAIHKLDIGEFDEIDYDLIAIHTTIEDYRLAYFINKIFLINLGKSSDEVHINVKEGETKFSRFYYYDSEKAIVWNLIQNKNKVFQNINEPTKNLFSNATLEISTKVFLLPEFKKVDFFLKIEKMDNSINVSDIKNKLNTIERISTAYVIDIDHIKSKNNLIF